MPFDAAGFRDDRDGDKPQPAVTTWSGGSAGGGGGLVGGAGGEDDGPTEARHY